MSNQGTPNQPFTRPSEPMNSSNTQRYQSPNSWNMEASEPLAVKDLDIIKNQLNHEALAYKKWSVYSGYFQDQTLSDMASTTAQHHKQHFESLQNYLNNHM